MTDATINNASIIDSETQAFEQKDNFNLANLIAHAARKSGRSAFAIGRDMIRHAHGKAKLKPKEYVQYGFYDPDRYTEDQKAEFISSAMHGKIVSECIDYGWFDVAGDKWLSSVFIGADGIATPDILAVIDPGPRAYQDVPKLDTAEALRQFLSQGLSFPLFCKFNNGRWSLGANIITAADQDHIHLRGKDPMSYEAFFNDFIGDNVFLIQEFVENHAFLKQYTPTTATVRMVNMWTDKGLWTPHAVLKLPASRNEADNFWREGNLVCQLDVDTGEILTVVGNEGPDLVSHQLHPETGKPIIGECLPHWQKLRELNERVAALHYPVRYQTQDIAITDDGPVEIEFNWGGAFELPQIAGGRGFMTPEVREFFRSCGSTRL